MNDFTKEELEDLYACCGGGAYDFHPLEDWKKLLRIKIKYMIDNYCEHEWVNATYCTKCEKGVLE